MTANPTGETAITRRRFTAIASCACASALIGFASGCSGGRGDEKLKPSDDDLGDNNNPPQPAPVDNKPIEPGSVCVSEYAGNTLAVLDGRTLEVIQRLSIGQNPASITLAHNKLYVGGSGGGEISAVDLSTGSFTRITAGNQPLGLCFDPLRNKLYAGDYFTGSVHIIDCDLDSLIGTIELRNYGYHNRTDPPECCRLVPGAGRRTVSMALAPEGDILYCANFGTYDIARIDLTAQQEIEAFDGVVGPRKILIGGDGANLILAGSGGEFEQQVSHLYVIDRASGSRIHEILVGRSVSGVCQSKDGAMAYAIARDDGVLVAIETSTWTETGRCPLVQGVDSLAISPDGATLYAAASATGDLLAVSANTLSVINRTTGMASPKDILVSI